MQRLRIAGFVLAGWLVFLIPNAQAAPPSAPDRSVVQTLLRQLDERSYFRRQEADLKLRQLGLGVVPLLRQELDQRPALEVVSRLECIINDLLALKWHGDLATAQNEARRTGKLLLVVSTLGKPNGQACLAALALQAKTLSDLEVVDTLQRDFVVVWNDHLSDEWYDAVYHAGSGPPAFSAQQVAGYAEGRGFQTLRVFFATPEGKILARLHGFHNAESLLSKARQLQDYDGPLLAGNAPANRATPFGDLPTLRRQGYYPALLGWAKSYPGLEPVLAEFSRETNVMPPYS